MATSTGPSGRAPAVDLMLRGVAYGSVDGVSYPRADPADASRLPADTWLAAQVPAGVRLELQGTAAEVDIDYTCRTDRLGHRGAGAGVGFAAWRGGVCVDEQPAELGAGTVRLGLGRGSPDDRTIVYLPEGMRPSIEAVTAVGGALSPAPPQPRWLAYGDSITEGWSASAPALTWTAVTARTHGLDLVNLGYAGSARAEIVSAEGIAALEADVVSVAVGTNCWNRVPHSAGMLAETLRGFLRLVRSGHPGTPVVVASPVLRPDAERAPNRLGATLVDLREAIEAAVERLVDEGDSRLSLVRGGDLLSADDLVDGVHPGDEGHRIIAEVVGHAVAAQLGG